MKRILPILLFACILITGHTQNLPDIFKLHADKNLILNVKQFGQFVKRFNYEEDFQGKPINSHFRSKIDRSNYILLLFNYQDPKFKDSTYLNLVGEFITQVTSDSIKINRLSDSTFSLAKCNVTLNKNPYIVFLVLHTEKIFDGYRWSLFDAYSDLISNHNPLFDTIQVYPQKNKFIPPTSNEVNFSHLRVIMDDKYQLENYISTAIRGNRINELIEVIKFNEFKFNYVEKLKYYIFDIPGWIIEISEYIRTGENSGWLISNIWKNTEKARNYMIENLDKIIK